MTARENLDHFLYAERKTEWSADEAQQLEVQHLHDFISESERRTINFINSHLKKKQKYQHV